MSGGALELSVVALVAVASWFAFEDVWSPVSIPESSEEFVCGFSYTAVLSGRVCGGVRSGRSSLFSAVESIGSIYTFVQCEHGVYEDGRVDAQGGVGVKLAF
jgi:hypothetical protein